MKNNNETWKIVKIIIGTILMILCILTLIGLITYIASESEKDTSKLMSGIAGIVVINEIIALKENFFPSKNEELEELKKIKRIIIMEKINISITEETMKALKEQAKKENKKYYDLAQEILAKATNTPCRIFNKKTK